MGKFVKDRVRTGQPPPGAFDLSLLHHTTIDIVQSFGFDSSFLRSNKSNINQSFQIGSKSQFEFVPQDRQKKTMIPCPSGC